VLLAWFGDGVLAPAALGIVGLALVLCVAADRVPGRGGR
jgi:hypothetical protein